MSKIPRRSVSKDRGSYMPKASLSANRNVNRPSTSANLLGYARTPLTSKVTLSNRFKNSTTPVPTPGSTAKPSRESLAPIKPHIKAFVLSFNPCIQNFERPSINDFIVITQVFLSVICGMSRQPLSMKNYKQHLPQILKDLGYSITIQQSLLKCPNIPQSFPQVLHIWAFLYEIARPLRDIDDVRSIMSCDLQFALHRHITEGTSAEEFEEEVYHIEGISKSEAEELSNEMKLLDRKNKEISQKLHFDQWQYKDMVAKKEALENDVQNLDIQTLEVKEKRLEKELEKTREALIILEQDYALIEKQRDARKQEIKAKGCQKGDLEKNYMEIDSKKKLLKLLEDRQHIVSEQRKEALTKNKFLKDNITSTVYEINNILLKKNIPADVRAGLGHDEAHLDELKLEDVISKTEIQEKSKAATLKHVKQIRKGIAKYEKQIAADTRVIQLRLSAIAEVKEAITVGTLKLKEQKETLEKLDVEKKKLITELENCGNVRTNLHKDLKEGDAYEVDLKRHVKKRKEDALKAKIEMNKKKLETLTITDKQSEDAVVTFKEIICLVGEAYRMAQAD